MAVVNGEWLFVPSILKSVQKSFTNDCSFMGNICCCRKATPVENAEGEDPEQIPQYFSFAEYFASCDRPTIYEYLFIKEIGKGAMSRVYLAINEKTGEQCAVKIYSRANLMKQSLGMDESPLIAVMREIDLMMALEHRYIISIIEAIQSLKTNSLLVVMPWASGSLQAQIDGDGINPSDIPICFFQIGEGLRYLHSQNVVHRDIKPDNVLLFGDRFYVLSDFSVSCKLEDPDVKVDDTKGSPAFLSPEECSGNSYLAKPADVWAYGVVLYTTVFRKLPFNLDSAHGRPVANTIILVAELLQTAELTFPDDVPEGCDATVVDVIKWILQKDPEARPTFEEIVNHEFFAPGRELDKEFQRDEVAQEGD
jgi:serine/threonine protein kinase